MAKTIMLLLVAPFYFSHPSKQLSNRECPHLFTKQASTFFFFFLKKRGCKNENLRNLKYLTLPPALPLAVQTSCIVTLLFHSSLHATLCY